VKKKPDEIRVLIACEFSGVVRRAFREKEFDVYSCDLLPAEDNSQHHFQMDVRELLNGDMYWDLMIAHPPCTYLANSGVRWLYERPERWKLLDEAAEFFKLLLDADIRHIAIENPIPHRYALERIGRRYDQIIQPWQFGHEETKAICLWLKNLPILKPTKIVNRKVPRVWLEPPHPDRWKNRSRFYRGIARAMADQWGDLMKEALNRR